MTLTEIMARIKLLWSERDSMGYVIAFQTEYPILKVELASRGITVSESLNFVEFEIA